MRQSDTFAKEDSTKDFEQKVGFLALTQEG